MVLKRTASYAIEEGSQVGEVRRAASKLATDLGFTEEDASRAAIVATELANNLLHHATGTRQLLLQRIGSLEASGVEMIAIDSGPGITDMSDAQRDGFSTGGSAGQGLGAMRRLATVFDIYSAPRKGTVVMTRVYPRKNVPAREEVGALSIPKGGETESGDACAWEFTATASSFMIADGLGHGPMAAEASAAAVAEFERASGVGAVQRVERIHDALRNTRGAAVAIAEIPADGSALIYSGLGNVTGVVLSTRARNLVSLHGTAGQDSPRFATFPAAWDPGSTLVLHSDGLNTRWDAFSYPGLLTRHPAVIAAVIYRDAVRGRDDASILVYRPAAGAPL